MPTAEHMRETLLHFRPSDYGLEEKIQELVAAIGR